MAKQGGTRMKTMLSKLTSALLCLAMLLTMCSFAMAEAGTYTGVGDSEIGGKGAIEVSVTVDENGVVTDIQVTKNGDTAGIADAAVEAMPGRIMAARAAHGRWRPCLPYTAPSAAWRSALPGAFPDNTDTWYNRLLSPSVPFPVLLIFADNGAIL